MFRASLRSKIWSTLLQTALTRLTRRAYNRSMEFERILGEKLIEAQSRSSRFSQRAMAKRLGLSSGALSEILRGKRHVSPKLAARIAERLDLSPAERRALGIEVRTGQTEFLLSADTFHLISDWWHFALLNLTQTEGFRSEMNWISRRLGISVVRVREAVERLERLGLLTKDARGRWKRSHKRLKTSDQIKSLAIQKAHREDLPLIEQALDEVPLELRDLSSITITVDPKRLVRLKEMIRKFQDEFIDEAESVPGKEVYRLAVHLFPLTRIGSNGGET